MTWVQYADIVVLPLATLLLYLMYVLFKMIQDIQHDLEAFRLEVAKTYVTASEQIRFRVEVLQMLEKVQHSLDKLSDRIYEHTVNDRRGE